MPHYRRSLQLILRLALVLFLFLEGGAASAATWSRASTPHFVLHFPPAMGEKADFWGERAETAYMEITERLGLRPGAKIPLYLYPQHRDFREAAGIRPHDLVVGTSETRGGLIRLDVSGLFSNAHRTLRHEIVHSVLALGLGPRVDDLPLWLNEGLAEVLGGPEDPAAEERVRLARGQGTLPKLSELWIEFPRGEAAGDAYAASYSATAYFVRLFGWEGVRELLAGVREGKGFSIAFREATDIDLPEFYASWESTLVRRGWAEWVQMFYFPATGLLMIWAMWMAWKRVMRRRKRIAEDEEPEREEELASEEVEVAEPDDELDYHSGLRPNTD